MKQVPIKQFGRNSNMRVNLKKNADGKWVINNRNSVLSRHRLNSRKLIVKNAHTNSPTVHYNEYTHADVERMPYLKYR